MENFSLWLKQQLESRGWKQSDLARASHLNTAVISNLINKKRGPGYDSCNAIAKAFKLPPEIVFRAAGLLPQKIDTNPTTEEFVYLVDQMSLEEQEELLAFARFKFNQRGRDKQNTRASENLA